MVTFRLKPSSNPAKAAPIKIPDTANGNDLNRAAFTQLFSDAIYFFLNVSFVFCENIMVAGDDAVSKLRVTLGFTLCNSVVKV